MVNNILLVQQVLVYVLLLYNLEKHNIVKELTIHLICIVKDINISGSAELLLAS